jgi:hypothetical protein
MPNEALAKAAKKLYTQTARILHVMRQRAA